LIRSSSGLLPQPICAAELPQVDSGSPTSKRRRSRDFKKMGADSGAAAPKPVFLKPHCDPAVAAPTQWRLDRGQMLLMNAGGDIWQFEAEDNAQWRRVPDSIDPLILVRQ
jgi:hypothetical protein